jgi:hypothetical protein
MAFHLGELVAKPTQDKENGHAVDAVIKLAWIIQEGHADLRARGAFAVIELLMLPNPSP